MKQKSLLFLLVCGLGMMALAGCDQNSANSSAPASTNMPSTNMGTNGR